MTSAGPGGEPKGFRFAIDRGGTFTDIYAEVPGDPGFRVLKLLSRNPAQYADAPREGIRRIIESVTGEQIDPADVSAHGVDWIRMGTTVATNALLERRGERFALMITKGFRDLLAIGNQDRPDLFDLAIRKPSQLYDCAEEVDERLRPAKPGDADDLPRITGITGETFVVEKQPDPAAVTRQLSRLKERGITALAVVFIHAWAVPDHERMVGELARRMGFTQVSLSHEVMPRIRMVPRGDTTCVDAYLTPVITAYLNGFREGFRGRLTAVPVHFMQSDGGLVPADGFKGSNAILSGPAGGVVGYAATTRSALGDVPVIGFDMGGTSTDVSRYDEEPELVQLSETAGVRIQAPQLDIRTVAAGGGSRLFYESGMFRVGPESAGAYPGPVCYRNNGHLSVTDANLILGRLHPAYFPSIFGPNADLPLDKEASENAFDLLTTEINADLSAGGHPPMTREAVALGFLKVADAAMVRPIREISVLRGYDVSTHVLACFGGAGGQHACSVARELGIRTVFVHRFSGILSAYGMGLAPVVAEESRPMSGSLSDPSSFTAALDAAEAAAVRTLTQRGFQRHQIQIRRYLHLRYEGTDTATMIAEPADGHFQKSFEAMHYREYGFLQKERRILVDDARVRAMASPDMLSETNSRRPAETAAPDDFTECCTRDGWRKTPVFRVERIPADQVIPGPALLVQDTATVVVEPGCEARMTRGGDLIITVHPETETAESVTGPDPVQLSIFSHLFMSIAEQMGRTLQKTALSTNIKERLDFSCAVFDEYGRLVANAPHVPVHLGAMDEAVRYQMAAVGDRLKPGDVILSNHPASGGSHLPDMTVITPVWMQGKPVFYLASRGHHADIGGMVPGSMPPFSVCLADEGAAIRSFFLVRDGEMDTDGLRSLLSGSRRFADNLADLKAQVAANQRGAALLAEMAERYTLDGVQAYMGYIQETAGRAVRRLIRKLAGQVPGDHRMTAEDRMDDGTVIRLTLSLDPESGTACFDFTGTGPQSTGNLNTPPAVVRSAILYALRCLVSDDIPLNHGCLAPVTIRIPEGTILKPLPDAAVVGGNVLTSQRVVDVIFKAVEAAAASQGCMNNLTFGNDAFGYYETIGGGAGAGPGWHGASGVHTHMTNTRITDPEILERRYPVVLEQFAIRNGSGGDGRFRGGDGLVREIRFLTDLTVSLLSERRAVPPYGLAGGNSGACGVNTRIRKDGSREVLGSKAQVAVEPGDRIRVETPGGGGYGA